MSDRYNKYRNLINLAVLFVFVSTVTGIIAYLSFAEKGLELPLWLTQISFYGYIAWAGLFGAMAFVIGDFVHKKTGKLGFLSQPMIHNPENSLLNDLGARYRIFTNPVALILISSIIFLWVGILIIARKAFLTGLPFVLEEASLGAKIGFSLEPVVSAENLIFLLILTLALNVTRYFIVDKWKLPKAVYWLIALIVIMPIIAYLGMNYHRITHGAYQANLFGSAIFWFGGAFTIIVLASVIPLFFLHWNNNLFLKLEELFAADVVVLIALFIAIIWTIIGGILLYRVLTKKEVG